MVTAPRIRSARCALEPFSKEFLKPRYVAWLNDSEVTRFSEQRHKTHSLESCRAYAESFRDTPHYFWAVVASDAVLGHIGNINCYIDPHNGVADVGILIGERRCWGNGFGTEAWIAVCRHLLLELKIRKVTAGTIASNTGMLGIMRRAGMRDDGRRIRQYVQDGKEVDMVYAALFAEDLR